MSTQEFSVVMSISTACGGEVCLTVTEPTKPRAELLGQLCSDAVERALRAFFPETRVRLEHVDAGSKAGAAMAERTSAEADA